MNRFPVNKLNQMGFSIHNFNELNQLIYKINFNRGENAGTDMCIDTHNFEESYIECTEKELQEANNPETLEEKLEKLWRNQK